MNEMTARVREILKSLQDPSYGSFQGGLIPTVEGRQIIGVRTPALKKCAKELAKDPSVGAFLEDLPHEYFEENQLHAFIVAEEKDFERCMERTERFLPYIDNWATCDQFSPKVFGKHREELLPHIKEWMDSGETYRIRFGIGMLMRYFLDEHFRIEYADAVAAVRSEEYYVNMMIAWYFATALAFRYEAVLPYLTERRLSEWVHRKTIQKAVESYRVPEERKVYLKGLRVK